MRANGSATGSRDEGRRAREQALVRYKTNNIKRHADPPQRRDESWRPARYGAASPRPIPSSHLARFFFLPFPSLPRSPTCSACFFPPPHSLLPTRAHHHPSPSGLGFLITHPTETVLCSHTTPLLPLQGRPARPLAASSRLESVPAWCFDRPRVPTPAASHGGGGGGSSTPRWAGGTRVVRASRREGVLL